MSKKSMKGRLGATLQEEEKSVDARFAKAETVLARKSTIRPEAQVRVIRDSFTMPVTDRDLISMIKKRCMRAGIDTNKSEILRAGLAAIDNMNDKELTTLFEGLTKVKTGRPLQAA